jgi:hypothetical protein
MEFCGGWMIQKFKRKNYIDWNQGFYSLQIVNREGGRSLK